MIPIRNLYFLLTYAWDVLDQAKVVNVGAQPLNTPEDLFGKLLKEGVQHLIHRGLDRTYNARTEEIPGIRGKVNLAATVKGMSLSKGRSYCEFDEYDHNAIHNQIIKATLRQLIRSSELDGDVRQSLKDLYQYFVNVDDVSVSKSLFRRVQLHSNNRFYVLLLSVCRILHDHLIPIPGGTKLRFVDFGDDQMEVVFEEFVRNYLRKTATGFTVKRERFPWQEMVANQSAKAVMPQLETDVSLISPERKIIVETKFYSKTLARRHRGDTSAIRATHLYQLVSYLENLSRRDNRAVDGILLYPKVQEDLLFDYELLGHKVRVATVDLNAEDSREIGVRLSWLTSSPIVPTAGDGSSLERLAPVV